MEDEGEPAHLVVGAQRHEQDRLLAEIQAFENETGDDGKLVHPHFQTLKDDITKLFQAGMTSDLKDAYDKALRLRPDLAASQPKPVKKDPDQAERVKRAKRAAAGVKSSGAVGKKPQRKQSLEEEIASLM